MKSVKAENRRFGRFGRVNTSKGAGSRAPCWRSNSAMSLWPLSSAKRKGVAPSLFLALTWAWLASSSSTTASQRAGRRIKQLVIGRGDDFSSRADGVKAGDGQRIADAIARHIHGDGRARGKLIARQHDGVRLGHQGGGRDERSDQFERVRKVLRLMVPECGALSELYNSRLMA